jgi:hypothetical protein
MIARTNNTFYSFLMNPVMISTFAAKNINVPKIACINLNVNTNYLFSFPFDSKKCFITTPIIC